MGKIIAVVNQKGGVGKTTTAVNLTTALKDLGMKVLLCDFDPQANATSGMGLDKRKIKYSVYDVTINGVPAEKAIIRTPYGDVLPSSADLAGAAVELIGAEHREHQLEKALKKVEQFYDGPEPLDPTHVREGCVVRIINRPTFTAYKHKNFAFKCLEGIVKVEATAPDMEEQESLAQEE